MWHPALAVSADGGTVRAAGVERIEDRKLDTTTLQLLLVEAANGFAHAAP